MDVDIASPGHKANPYPFHARLRAECPVQRVTLPDRQTAWLITRYEDVAAVLKDERFVKDKAAALTAEQAARQPWVPRMSRPLEQNMLDLDPPDQTRLRGSVHRAFTPGLVEGEHLSGDELVAMVFLLLVAGHETTVDLIGNGTLAPLMNPAQAERLRGDSTLLKSAVEELLRYDSPLETATERFAREDVSLAGVTIPRGGLVYAALASANRDERQFPNPDVLDISREPDRHLSFGLGPHYCLGAPLARLVGQVAIGTLLSRLPDLRLTVRPESLRWRRGLVLRGLEALSVTFTKAW